MAKKEKQTQLDLIDVSPENRKQIVSIAREYKRAVHDRDKAKERMDVQIERLREEIAKTNLKPVDGKIEFTVDGFLITVTPKDDDIKVKEQGEDKEN